MTPTSDPTGPPSADLKSCPTCSRQFHPRRKDQKYCEKGCAKAATRHALRGSREKEQERADRVHYNRALDLADMLYTTPVSERLGVMKTILHAAVSHDSGLRRILTDPKLLRANSETPQLFHRRAAGSYKTISQAANAYTKKFFGVSIKTYLQQARSDTLREDHEVSRSVDHGAVPKLTKIRKAKCWHSPLPDVQVSGLRAVA